MARLEDLTQGAAVGGIRQDGPVSVVNVQWYGSDVLELMQTEDKSRGGEAKFPGTHAHTRLGQKLRTRRATIVRSGIPLLSWEEVEEEIDRRRGDQDASAVS